MKGKKKLFFFSSDNIQLILRLFLKTFPIQDDNSKCQTNRKFI
jgi:hypothetical protein